MNIMLTIFLKKHTWIIIARLGVLLTSRVNVYVYYANTIKIDGEYRYFTVFLKSIVCDQATYLNTMDGTVHPCLGTIKGTTSESKNVTLYEGFYISRMVNGVAVNLIHAHRRTSAITSNDITWDRTFSSVHGIYSAGQLLPLPEGWIPGERICVLAVLTVVPFFPPTYGSVISKGDLNCRDASLSPPILPLGSFFCTPENDINLDFRTSSVGNVANQEREANLSVYCSGKIEESMP
ncbi:hypothetical protein U0026_20075 [Kluyvera intermedia]|uniref:hypothetical protein n=1 Tax=Kluyvera intermedia TaxID=61648 RepID=UPI000AD58B9D|nr:hypothetical protein [Kluyvera intermedia]WQD29267.1 hypothetical protein U0026_20075 [Kluyvera intermedia]VDZ85063.1 Uncharacterised protein [Kluyvera intermedia]